MSWHEFLPQWAARYEMLESLYADIGTPEDQKQVECKALFDRFDIVMNDHIQNVEQERNRLCKECDRLAEDIQRLTELIGQGQDALERIQQDIEDQSVWDRHRILADEYSSIYEVYKTKLDQVRELHGQLEAYAVLLGPSFVQPGPFPDEGAVVNFQIVQQFSDNIAECEREQKQRLSAFESFVVAIRHLWTELGETGRDSFDRQYIENDNGSISVLDEVMKRLETKQAMLEDERRKRQILVKEKYTEIAALWSKLRILEEEREQFMSQNVGLTLDVIRAYKSELQRLQDLKSEKLEEFIYEARDELFELWDRLYYSLEQRESFKPVLDTEFTEECLALHEAEGVRLRQELLEIEPILNTIERYRMLLDDIREFEMTSMDAQRLFQKGGRDPGRLLREEKFRKRIAREFPKLEFELETALDQWQQQHGRPFLVYGEEYIVTMKTHAQQAREGKENEKLWREQRKHLSLQRELRYGSKNPKAVKQVSLPPRRISPSIPPAPAAPHFPTRTQSPPEQTLVTSSFSQSMPSMIVMPTTPKRANHMINLVRPPGTPQSNGKHNSSSQQFMAVTPTKPRSFTLHTASSHSRVNSTAAMQAAAAAAAQQVRAVSGLDFDSVSELGGFTKSLSSSQLTRTPTRNRSTSVISNGSGCSGTPAPVLAPAPSASSRSRTNQIAGLSVATPAAVAQMQHPSPVRVQFLQSPMDQLEPKRNLRRKRSITSLSSGSDCDNSPQPAVTTSKSRSPVVRSESLGIIYPVMTNSGSLGSAKAVEPIDIDMMSPTSIGTSFAQKEVQGRQSQLTRSLASVGKFKRRVMEKSRHGHRHGKVGHDQLSSDLGSEIEVVPIGDDEEDGQVQETMVGGTNGHESEEWETEDENDNDEDYTTISASTTPARARIKVIPKGAIQSAVRKLDLFNSSQPAVDGDGEDETDDNIECNRPGLLNWNSDDEACRIELISP